MAVWATTLPLTAASSALTSWKSRVAQEQMLSIKNTVQIITPSQKDYVRPGTLDATFLFVLFW